MASPISKVIKYINKSGEEKEITLYDNPASFSDYDGGTYIAVQADKSTVGYIYCNSELKDNADLFSKFLDKNGNVRYAYNKEQNGIIGEILIAEYTFTTGYNTLPKFNENGTGEYAYKIKDNVNNDGTTTRQLYSNDLPTQISFYNATDSNKLLTVNYINTSEITTMYAMFNTCSSLTSVNTSDFDTGKVTDMSFMFCNCPSLISADLSSFDTSLVTDISFMFSNCSSLTSLNLSNFNAINVVSMARMFNNCSSLISLNLSNFNTINVANMSYLFNNCSNLKSIDIRNLSSNKLLYYTNMFKDIKSTCKVYVNKSKFTKTASECGFRGSFTYVRK